MYLGLLKDPVNSENMVEDLIEEHQRNIQFFLIEDLQSRLDIVPQLLSFHGKVVLGHPVAEQDGSLECRLTVNAGEVLHGYCIDIFLSPCSLFIIHQPVCGRRHCEVCVCVCVCEREREREREREPLPVLEETESLMTPYSDKTLYR